MMNLYMIGYRGSGKSSVAPIVARLLDWACIDTDEQIEILRGISIAEIFAAEGEAGFRQWETTVLQAVSRQNRQVIALGGGAPTVSTNREIMRDTGRTVWLTAPAEILWQRIAQDVRSQATRPRLTDLSGEQEVRQLLQQRQEIYAACADYTIDTSNKTTEQIADQIAKWFDPVDT